MPHVHGAVLLAQIEITGSLLVPHGIAVLPLEGGELAVGVALLDADVAGDAAGVVLAPLVLIALDILIQDAPVCGDAHLRHRPGAEEVLAAAPYVHLIEFGEGACGIDELGGRGHACTLDDQPLVREPCHGCLAIGAGSYPAGLSARGRHYVHVQSTVAVAAEGNLAAVGTP